MSDPDYIFDFEGHKLCMKGLFLAPLYDHAKIIDKFAQECGVKPTDTLDPNGRAFVAALKPVYWRWRAKYYPDERLSKSAQKSLRRFQKAQPPPLPSP